MNDQSFSKNLLSWYFNSPSAFPWRKTKNPYKIWLSEIMLQQTRAATVIPYYENWILKFPTLNAVSHSSLDDVLKAWEDEHPNWNNSENETKIYMELVQKIMGGSSDEEINKNYKLIQKKIGKNVSINDIG